MASNPFDQFDQPNPFQIDPDVQAQRERQRLELLKQERARSTDPTEQAALDKEMKVNKPIMGRIADAMDTGVMGEFGPVKTAETAPVANPFDKFDNPFDQFDEKKGIFTSTGHALSEANKKIEQGYKERGPLMGTWDTASATLKTLVQGIPEMFLGTGEGIYNYLTKVLGKNLSQDQVRELIQSRPFTQAVHERLNSLGGVDPNNKIFQGTEEGIGAILGSPITIADEQVGPEAGLATEIGMVGFGAMGLRKATKPQPPRPRPVVDGTPAPLRSEPVTEGVNLPPDSVMAPEMLQRDMFGTEGVADMPWRVDENGMPYKQDISQLNEPGLFDPPQEGMAPQRPLPGATPDMFQPEGLDGRYRKKAKTPIQKTETPPDTLPENWPSAQDRQGNVTEPGYFVDNIERQGQRKPGQDQGPDSIPYYPDEPTRAQEQQRISQVDHAWEEFKAEKERQQREQYEQESAADKLEPSQGSREIEKIQKPIGNRSGPKFGPRARQRGGVDISGLAPIAEGIRKGVDRTKTALRGLAARRAFLEQRFDELNRIITTPGKTVAEYDAARKELFNIRLFLKETMDKQTTQRTMSGIRKSQAGAINPDALKGLSKFDKYMLTSLMRLPDKSFYTRGHIDQVLARPDVTEAEKTILRNALGDREGIGARELAEKVHDQIIELNTKLTDEYADYGMGEVDLTDVNGPHSDGLKHLEPKTSLQQLPFEHLLDNHFGEPSNFAHSRYIDHIDHRDGSGNYQNGARTRTFVELQSDAVQKLRTLSDEELIKLGERHRDNVNNYDRVRQLKWEFDRGGLLGLQYRWNEVAPFVQSLIDNGVGGNVFGKTIDDILKRDGVESADWHEIALEAGIERAKTLGSHANPIELGMKVISRGLHWLAMRAEAELGDTRGKLVGHQQARDEGPKFNLISKDWWKRIIREEIHQVTKHNRVDNFLSESHLERFSQSSPITKLRFATADTMAKVEGWFDSVGKDTELGRRVTGIYNRYKKDIEPWLKKEFGAKEVEFRGHTYLEFPTPDKDFKVQLYGNRDQSVPQKTRPTGLQRNQGGMINFGALFGKDKPTRSDDVAGMSKENMNDIIASLLTTSRSPESFKDKLSLFSEEPAWVNNIVNRADAIWADRDNFLHNYKGSVFSKLSNTDQKMTADLRSGEIFLREEQPKELPASSDIALSSRLANPTSVIRRVTNPAARKWLNWMISNAQEYANMGNKLFQRMIETQDKFSQLTRDEQLKLRDVQIKFDGTQNSTLQDLGLQWATADMLRKEGLSDYQIEAYQRETKGLDMAYKMIEQVFHDWGMEPPERIPGWFPHTWLGSYRLLISGKDGLHTVRAYHTKVGRDLAMKEAKREFPDGIVEKQDPQAALDDRSIADAMLQALQVFKAKDGLGQAIVKKLANMDERQHRGIIKEALEREGVHGYDAEQGIRTDLGTGRRHNDRLIAAYGRYLQHVSQFWTNAQIAANVKRVINDQGHLFVNTPQLWRYMQDFLSTATGRSINHGLLPTEILRSIAITLGLPPNVGVNMLNGLAKYMVWSRLRFPNPKFMAANLIQPVTQLADIMQVHTDRILGQERGENVKLGNPMKAVTTVLREFAQLGEHGSWSPWAKEALKYAMDNNKIEIFMADHVDPIRNSDPIRKSYLAILDTPNNVIEKRGRIATYLGHVAYNLDAGMPKREAYEAAANQIDLAMGNYNKMHAPTMYGNFGVTGQSLRPFALLRNTYIGKGVMSIQTLINSYKTSPRAAMWGTMNLGSFLSGWVLFAGLTGAIGMNEYDAIVRLLNSSFDLDTPLPRAGALLRKWGAPNWLLYGLLSDTTGVNIGPSLAAPALAESVGIPAIDTAKNLWTAGVQGVNALEDTGADQQKLYQSVRSLAPNVVQPWVEKLIADKQGGVTPQATKFDNGYRRDTRDFATAAVTGARSLKEQEAREIHALTKYDEKVNKDWKAQQVSKIVDSMLGIGPDNSVALIRNAIEAGRGFDADSLKQSITKELDRRLTDFETQELEEIKGTASPAEKAYKAQRYMDLHRMQSK